MPQQRYLCPPGQWTKLSILDAQTSGSTQADTGGGDLNRPVLLLVMDDPGAVLDDSDRARAIIALDRKVIPWQLNGTDTIFAQPVNSDETVDVRVVS